MHNIIGKLKLRCWVGYTKFIFINEECLKCFMSKATVHTPRPTQGMHTNK
jgi:hypothetical protein